MLQFIKYYGKGGVAFAILVVGGAISHGLLHGAVAGWADVLTGALTTLGVVVTKNAPNPRKPDAVR